MQFRRVIPAVAAGVLVAPVVPLLLASPAGAVSAPEIVADGLDNPYKISFGPDGALYVAEAGTGGEDGGECVETEGPEGPTTACLGTTGAITRVDLEADTQERVVEGLPSEGEAGSGGNGAGGAVDVEVDEDGNYYIVVGLGGPPERRNAYTSEAAALLGTVVRVDGETGERTVFADLAAFEGAEDPDAGQPGAEGVDTNPYDLELAPNGFLAADAGGNDILAISGDGEISVAGVLPFGQAEAPPFIDAPPGTMLPTQPVPTSVSVGPRGTLIGQLTGFPFPIGQSPISELAADGTITPVEEGLTGIVDIAQAPDGTVYAIEFASNGVLAAETGGDVVPRVIQIRPDGTRKVLLESGLNTPNGIAVGPDGLVYVANGSQTAGVGNVIVVDPSVASDPNIADACAPNDVPGAEFSDVGGSVHREAIDCVAWFGIMNGRTDGTFGEQVDTVEAVSRAQVGSVLVRLLQRADVDLPASPPNAFTDDEGSVHEANLNILAALGIFEGEGGLVSPGAAVTEASMASLLVRIYEDMSDTPLEPGDDAYANDGGSVHEAATNAAVAAGWFDGTSENPAAANLSRGDVATTIARFLSTLVGQGDLETPAVG